ncbi:MAG: putative protein kinase [Chlamydiales bacterium]|jgi:hypothetical protein|nr:putative protein kinase [Chlamydiales bacterium]
MDSTANRRFSLNIFQMSALNQVDRKSLPKSLSSSDDKVQIARQRAIKELSMHELDRHGIDLGFKKKTIKNTFFKGNQVPLKVIENGQLTSKIADVKAIAAAFQLTPKEVQKFKGAALSAQMTAKLQEAANSYEAVLSAYDVANHSPDRGSIHSDVLFKTMSLAIRTLSEQKTQLLEVEDLQVVLTKKPGESARSYVILPENPLGEGSFGVIKKIIDTDTHEVHVMKQDKEEFERDSLSVVEREYLILKDLHERGEKVEGIIEAPKHLVYLTDDASAAKKAGFIMRRYQGDLEINQAGQFPSEQIPNEAKLKGAEALLKGLAFLHGQEIAHQDIKPANVLYAQRGRQYDFCLSDFDGVLDLKKQRALPSDIAHTNRFVPVDIEKNLSRLSLDLKKRQGEEGIETKAEELKQLLLAKDLFCMGCVLYQMLADQPAFPQETLSQEGKEAGHIRMDSQLDLAPLEERGYSQEIQNLIGDLLDLANCTTPLLDAKSALQDWQTAISTFNPTID